MKYVKSVLRDVTHKGYFYRPNPHIQRRNVFTRETDSEWKHRRTLLSRAFSPANLRKQTETIKRIVDKFIRKLSDLEREKKPVAMDSLFSQLTVDVIAQVGFQYEIDALGLSGKLFFLQ